LANDSPIGVFDSGVGGLSVLRQIHALLPSESLLYAADTAHIPYGDKSPAYVRRRVNVIAESLVEMGAKGLVVACNTATAAAVESLRQRFAMPVVGMEPGVKPAVLCSRQGVVGILATEGMAHSQRMEELVKRFCHNVEAVVQPCPGLVEQVEHLALDTPETARLLKHYLEPLLSRGADTLVLGCTHYPFLKPLIEHLVGPGVSVIDTGPAIARRLAQLLTEAGLLNDSPAEGAVRFFTSGDPSAQQQRIAALWGEAVTVASLPETASP